MKTKMPWGSAAVLALRHFAPAASDSSRRLASRPFESKFSSAAPTSFRQATLATVFFIIRIVLKGRRKQQDGSNFLTRVGTYGKE